MKRAKVAYYFLVVMVVILSGCTKDFEEINKNPNYPEEVTPNLVLTNILYQTARDINSEALYYANGLSQYTARFDFNDLERYDIGSNPSFWSKIYGLIRDIDNLESMAEEANNDGYKAVGLIMRAYLASHLTDLWGDVPYFEAFQGREGKFTPQYNSQREIYTAKGGIIDNLKEANEILKTSSAIIQGDIIYNGDLVKWQKFANSLSLRYLMRISAKASEVTEINISSEIARIIANEPLMESNADNALMRYLPSHPNQFILHTVRDGDFNLFRLSDTFEETLKDFNDPRLAFWFRPTEASEGSDTPEYFGMPVGLNTSTQSDMDIQLTEVSRMARIFREEPNSVDAVMMSYSELQFIIAEAAARGLIDGGLSIAQEAYQKGVNSSFAYWGVAIPSDYLTQPNVSLGGTSELDKILSQKWIANFMVGYESWYDFRRTGLPAIKPVIDNSNSGLVPSRFFYPSDEQSLNASNYQAAIAKQPGGSDNINTRVWWEK